MKKIILIVFLVLVVLILAFVWKSAGKNNSENTELKNQSEILDQKSDLIVVDNPVSNQKIKSPLKISGKARGNWFFEASFPVELVDSEDGVVAQGIATANGEWMTTDFVPFEATLTFSANQSLSNKSGKLILRKDNPSGLPEHDDFLEIPVVFE